MQKWVNEVPNEGLIRYNYLFNAERILITSPKALGEVLVQRSYEFVKPENIRHGLGRILGVGVLLAEGEEHKVSCNCSTRNPTDKKQDPAQKSFASVLLSPCQGSLSWILDQVS